MKKTLLPLTLVLSLNTTAAFAANDDEAQRAANAKALYQKKLEPIKKEQARASKQLSKDYEQYGQFNEKVARDYKNISDAAFKLGEYDTAIESALHALKVEMKLRKEDDPVLAKLYFDTGNIYYMYKQHPTAILYMEKAAKIYQNSPKKESLALADTYEAIASIYINLEDLEKSLAYSKKTLEIRENKLKHTDEALQRARMNITYLKSEIKKQK